MKIQLTLLFILIFNYAFAQIGNTWLLITFEDNMGNFYEDYIKIDTSSTNIWQIGTPNKSIINYTGAQVSHEKGIVTDTSSSYPVNAYSSFILTIPFQFMGDDLVNWIFKCQCDYTNISFLSKFDTDTLTDGGTIELSYDGGQSWINAISDTIYDEGNLLYDSTSYVSSLNQPGYSGVSIESPSYSDNWFFGSKYWYWIHNLNVETPDSIMVKFVFASDSIQNNRGGWLIDEIGVVKGLLIGVEEIKIEENFSVYPNPVTSILSVKAKEDFNFRIYIYDLTGKLILEKEVISGIDLNVEYLSTGIYNIVIETPASKYIKQIVKHF
jgi:hypothetical protein